MSKVNDVAAVIEKIEKCSESLIAVSEQMNFIAETTAEILAELKKDSGKPAPKVEKKQEPVKEKALSLTEVRKILADKSRAGFTAEIKQILIKHGAEKLSEIAPTEYAALVADVEVLSNE